MSRMELVWELMQKQLELDELREKFEALAGSRSSPEDSPVSSTTASAPGADGMELRGRYCSSAWPAAGAPVVAIVMILALI
ncbi:hypothetical protein FOL47_011325 [Perkinsus chesapeaki]|uniref:Uncharacterized protein n=1 Tax=Perkinsus chesapeaki TaxID=330153 RepID=A0A7J6MMU9_PERCH|nr:hypothetical protein FOL47_011325 [Perkinsus chesapeaki]